MDDSDLTVNVCLGLDFEGSDLEFVSGVGDDGCVRPEGLALHTYAHEPGRVVFHSGGVPHGVSWLRSGSRYSLILLCSDAETADGGVLRLPKPTLPEHLWQDMLLLQERT